MRIEEQIFIKRFGARPDSGDEVSRWAERRLGWLQCLNWLSRFGHLPESKIKEIMEDESLSE